MNPQICFAASCSSVAERVLYDRNYFVCEECALIINSISSCPIENPMKEPEKPVNKKKSQSKEAMKREIQKSQIRRDARTFQSYNENIVNLLKRYKK